MFNRECKSFTQAMHACGITPPDTLIADGKIHRFGRKKKGWYVLHSHADISSGSFGEWGAVDSQNWCSKKASQLSTSEREAWRKQRSEQIATYQAELLAKQKQAANKAIYLWNKARSDVDPKHAYLIAKGIYPHGGKQLGQALLIPVYGQDKQLTGCQFIYPDGSKKFLTGTKKQGSFCCLTPPDYHQNDTQTIYLVEGYATGVSVFTAMNSLVFVAFDKGNLKAVAVFVRSKNPQTKIVICGDNDADNGGQQAANEAAQAINGIVTIPKQLGDWNDTHQVHGLQAVKKMIENALHKTNKPQVDDGLTLLKASEVKARPIDWLWFGYIAKGKFHLLAGMPSTGKTTIAMSIAATVSNGGLWPDGTPCKQGNVIVWSGEDGLDDTLVPRLIAHRANLDKIYFVSDVIAKGEKRPFDPASDMAMLCQTVKAIGDVSLIIVDPIVSAITGDSHKNAEVRRGLQPLVDLGDELNAAILGISHFSKGTKGNDPMERVTGSIAYTALARIVLVTAKKADENNTITRIFTRAKSNIGLDGGGFNYDIESADIPTDTGTAQTTKAVFGNWLDGSALHLLADTESEQEGGTEVTDAAGFLLDLFKDATLTQDGTIEKKEIIRLATANGFKERTIQRAREKLGIEFSPSGFGSQKKSVWRMPKNVTSANDEKTTDKNDVLNNPTIVPFMPIVPSKKGRDNNGMNGDMNEKNENTSIMPPIVTLEKHGTHGTIGTNGENSSDDAKVDVSVISANHPLLDGDFDLYEDEAID